VRSLISGGRFALVFDVVERQHEIPFEVDNKIGKPFAFQIYFVPKSSQQVISFEATLLNE